MAPQVTYFGYGPPYRTIFIMYMVTLCVLHAHSCMQAKMCASVWMEDSSVWVILAAAVHLDLGAHFVNTTTILVSSWASHEVMYMHTHTHIFSMPNYVYHCIFYALLWLTCNSQKPSTSFLHCEQGVPASMTATLMPVTVFVKKVMGACTVKLLLEKVRFAHIGSPCVHICVHMFKPYTVNLIA